MNFAINYERYSTWNIRLLIDDSFVPSSTRPSVSYCKLTNLCTMRMHRISHALQRYVKVHSSSMYYRARKSFCYDMCKYRQRQRKDGGASSGGHRLRTPREEIAFSARPKNSIPIPNFQVWPKHILSATSAQFFRYLSFMPSLGVHSPCPWPTNLTVQFSVQELVLSLFSTINTIQGRRKV